MNSLPRVLLAGTGKMARDVGGWLLRKGFPVAFVGRAQGLSELQTKLAKDARRLAGDDLPLPLANAAFHTQEDAPPADLVLECLAESLATKRTVVAPLRRRIPESAPVLSCSSSLLPTAIDARGVGTHFFYPVELTGFLELVLCDGVPDEARAQAQEFVRQTGLRPIVQTERNAFAVNRLLLPLQERCFELLLTGARPSEVDQASRSALLPLGQLTLLDGVGLDTAAAAVDGYGAGQAWPALERGLRELGQLGKLGQKNADGLVCGRPLPWARPQPAVPSAVDLERFFRETCARFLAEGELSAADLQVALAGLFGTTWDGRS